MEAWGSRRQCAGGLRDQEEKNGEEEEKYYRWGSAPRHELRWRRRSRMSDEA